MRRLAVGLLVGLLLAAAGLVALDRWRPPALGRLAEGSTVVVDRNGVPLRVFLSTRGQWRLPADPAGVPRVYRDLLVDIEDKRFFTHPGVDALALARAALQRLVRGRIVSGGSTLTMQVVRLLEPRPRTLRSKLIEIARALQLEAHWSKTEILDAYATLAPMGRNLEGVRAGSLAWFGKEPATLSDAEAALLVALPRDPNRLRPDRPGSGATAARAIVLRRGIADGVLPPQTLRSALAAPLPDHRRPLPMLAPHRTEQLAAAAPAGSVVETTLDAALQPGVERVLSQALEALPRPVTLAAMVADWRTGAIRARVGSASYFDARRNGAVDMTEAVRSPGSTLKPFIYGMAFDGLRAHPGSLVHDAATRFDDYAPHNFDGTFNGDVTVRQALQWSLNMPAVLTLQKLGPVVFTERFKAAGLGLDLGASDSAPGLPLALGGVGTTLATLVEAYAGLANEGVVTRLFDQPGPAVAPTGPALFEPGAADAVVDILADMPPPSGARSRAGRIAYKTGTSYRFRDGWAIGFDDARVIGIWMGRADGGTCPCVGAAAATLLFRLFDLFPPAPLPARALPPAFAGPPPPALARLDAAGAASGEDRPHITFPISQSRLLVDAAPAATPVKLAATGGARPYHWTVDGKPVESQPFARQTVWHPEGEGFSTVAVVDALGHTDQASIRIMSRGAP